MPYFPALWPGVLSEILTFSAIFTQTLFVLFSGFIVHKQAKNGTWLEDQSHCWLMFWQCCRRTRTYWCTGQHKGVCTARLCSITLNLVLLAASTEDDSHENECYFWAPPWAATVVWLGEGSSYQFLKQFSRLGAVIMVLFLFFMLRINYNLLQVPKMDCFKFWNQTAQQKKDNFMERECWMNQCSFIFIQTGPLAWVFTIGSLNFNHSYPDPNKELILHSTRG